MLGKISSMKETVTQADAAAAEREVPGRPLVRGGVRRGGKNEEDRW